MKNLVCQSRWTVIPLLILSLTFQGCIRYRPNMAERTSFMERVQTQEKDNLRVSVTVLSDKETKKAFGVNLAKKGMQPVWLDIENKNTAPAVLITRSIDPNYYSAEEAAYLAHYRQSRQFLEAGILAVIFFPALALIPFNFFAVRHANKKMDAIFRENGLDQTIILPHNRQAGFVFTGVDEGSKEVTIDLLLNRQHTLFTFHMMIPGIKPDFTTKDYEARYSEQKIRELSETELADELKKISCCTTNKKGTKQGDPINLVVIGELEDLVTVFTSARWDMTEALTLNSGYKMAKAFLTGENDRYSPVSPLYYGGHSHDLAFQKTRNNINQRLHFRLWYTPWRFQSKPVWIGAISRDIGVKFTWKTWYLTTHKIDPNLDDARNYLLADLIGIEKIARGGYLKVGDPILSSKPGKNLTNDPYYTDNKRLVMELSTHDTELNTFSWNQFFD